MKEFRDEAVVLRTYRSGEADRIAVLFTRAHGKVRVLARGSRKASSRLGAALETLGHVRVDAVASRGPLFIVRHVEHVSRLATLRQSYSRINAGYAVVEAVDAIPSEGTAEVEIFDLLVRVLKTLDDERYTPDLIPATFFLRLLALDGSAPVLEACVNCQSVGPLVAFDAQAGGVLCGACRRGNSLSAAALELMRRVTGGDLAALLRESNVPGAGDLMTLAQEAIENHFARRLRAPSASTSLATLDGERS